MADNIKMTKTEEKGYIVYTFGFAFTTKNDEYKWNEKAIVARRGGATGDEAWDFEFKKFKDMDINNFRTYQTLMQRVNQVVETDGMNLMGIKVEHPKVAK